MNNNSMRKYFSKVKGRIIIIAIIILIISVTDIFRPIIEANLLTSITELNYKMAIWFSVFPSNSHPGILATDGLFAKKICSERATSFFL